MSGLHVMLANGSLFGGGAEHVIATLARHLRDGGHRVTVVVIHRGGEIQAELIRDGFDVISEIAKGGGESTARRLNRLIRERGVDLVHSHDLRSLIDAGWCRLGNRQIAHMHTFHFGNYPHVPFKHLLMEGIVARVPDQLVAVGHAQRASLLRALRLRPERITTIWNGVDFHGLPEPTNRAPGPVPILGSVCTFGPQKGLPTLMAAAKILRDRGLRFRLVLVGEGGMRGELEQLVRTLGIDGDVEFTGWRPDAATRWLPTFDVFVQSSYWEAMSIVVLEAMAARLPIVATRVGENDGVLVDGDSAILVPPRDPQALADGLARVLTDPDLARRLGVAAHARQVSQFTGRAMADRYVTAYRQCLSRRGLAAGARHPETTRATGGVQ